MAKKKNENKNPYTPAFKNAMKEERDKAKKHKIIVASVAISVAVLIVTAIVLAAIFLSSKRRTNNMIESAEALLLSSSYKLVLSSSASSPRDDINDKLNTDTLKSTVIIDGENFAYIDDLGDASIKYYYIGNTRYIDESFIGAQTKSDVTAEAKAAAKEEYIIPNITVFSVEDYEDFDISEDDNGNITVTVTGLNREKIEELESELRETIGKSDDGTTTNIDSDETKVTIVFDSEGRYKSIEQIYGFAFNYPDASSALVKMTRTKEYSYGDSAALTVPSGKYIDNKTDDFKDVFGSSFTVTTDSSVSFDTTQPDYDNAIYTRLLSLFNSMPGYSGVLGEANHNVLRVDGDNFEIIFGGSNTVGEDEITFEDKYTLVGDMIYSYYTATNGETTFDEKGKQQITDDLRRICYPYFVMKNIYPSYARDFTSVKKSTTSEGNTKIVCSGLSADFSKSLNQSINYYYHPTESPVRLTPMDPEWEFEIAFDADGRIASTKLTLAMDVDLINPEIIEDYMDIGSVTMVISRDFDYDAANEYYKDLPDNADRWVSAPSDASDYRYTEIYPTQGSY